jgi:GntR family transcriptional regulator, transcriptional repressor for pyruvate dehydrogenase complex
MSADYSWSPVRKIRTHEQVVAQIQGKILDGELRVGARLPSERELVDALGVSRSSVREALRALEAMGIIESNVGTGRDAGSFISGRSTEALGNLLRLHVALAGIELADLVEVRIQLERHAALGAAMYSTRDDLTELRRLIEAMAPSRVSSEQFNELDTELHVRIAKSSRSGLTATLMQALRSAVKSEMVRAFVELDDWRPVGEQLVAEHSAVIDAIESRDAEKAADLVETHIRNFYRNQIAHRD